jgi:hypothetical protein
MVVTHLGVPASQLVLLESIGVEDSINLRDAFSFFRRNYETGYPEPIGGKFGYSAPYGKAMILTEVDWQFENGMPGGNVTLRFFLNWPDVGSGDPRLNIIFERVFESTILLGSNGGGGTTTSLTTGIVVPSGIRISCDIAGTGSLDGKLQHALLRGYLADLIFSENEFSLHPAGR